MMKIKNGLITFYCKLFCTIMFFAMSDHVWANLDATARRATTKVAGLGKVCIGLFVVISGIYFVTGSPEAKEKIKQVIFGAVLILAGKSLVSFLIGAIK